MVKYINIILISVFSTAVCLFVVNYLTLVGYHLPHRIQIIYEQKYDDIFVRVEPMYFAYITLNDNKEYGRISTDNTTENEK